MYKVMLAVDGMTCTSCSGLIERGLMELEGVDKLSVAVTLLSNTADLVYDSSVVEVSAILETIDDMGFESKVLENKPIVVPVDGEGTDPETTVKDLIMTCVSGGAAGGQESSSLAFAWAVVRHSLARTFSVTLPLLRVLAVVCAPVWQQFYLLVASPSGGKGSNEDGSTNTYTVENLATLSDHMLACEGVSAVDTSFALKEGHVVVTVDEAIMGPRRVAAAFMAASGLRVTVASMGGFMNASRMMKRHNKEMIQSCSTVLMAMLLTVPVLVMTMVLPPEARAWEKQIVFPGMSMLGLLLLLLVTPVQFGLGWQFHVKAYKSMRVGTLGMDFLVSTGTNAAYMYSFIGIVRGLVTGVPRDMDTHYFETAAVLITVILLGKYLELFAKGRTAAAIHKLNSLKPKTARLVEGVDDHLVDSKRTVDITDSPGGSAGGGVVAQEDIELTTTAKSESHSSLQRVFSATSADRDRVIDASLLQRGDVIRVVEGEIIPADGTIVSAIPVGVDESMMTGESRVITRGEGDTIFGGTLVVEGSAVVRLTACGDESVLGRIVSTVQEAQTSKVPIQEIADNIAARFVPAVTVVSLLTFGIWLGCAVGGVVPKAWLEKESDGNPVFFAFLFALAVWVSACPCAFGLATPTAILVSTGVAASHGILIRRGAALQYAAGVKTIAFDKTGTLTHGNTAVTDCYWCPSIASASGGDLRQPNSQEKRILLQLMLRAESISTHPISKGISLFCSEQLQDSNDAAAVDSGGANELKHLRYLFQAGGEDRADAKAVPGAGIAMTLRAEGEELSTPNPDPDQSVDVDSLVLVGNASLLTSMGVEISEEVLEKVLSFRKQGKIAVFYSYGRRVCGVVALSDTVRREARTVINYLQQQRGIECYMITGDDEVTALAVAATIGLEPDHVYASAKPTDKQRVVKQLQDFGTLACGSVAKSASDDKGVGPTGINSVCFVGDGTNDSPALAQANVGVAMAGGTDIAVETGDMVLCKSDLFALLIAIDISRITMRRIMMNYMWAFIYNLLLIPLAAGIFYPSFQMALDPMLAGAAMALSSVSIVASSLLLGFYRPPAAVSQAILGPNGK